MTELVTGVLLPAALGFIMFGLGLTQTLDDFRRIVTIPKAAVIALTIQLFVLPALCFGLITLFGLDGELAVGMMLLAASPGGTTANLFSHLAGGDVALNITLTAVNSALSVIALPVVIGLSITHFLGDESTIGLQVGETLRVFAIVLVPVAVGMFVRSRFPRWCSRAELPVRRASVAVLVVIILLALVGNFDTLRNDVANIGLVALSLCVLSLIIGYAIPRLVGVEERQAISSAFEVGIHNSTVAITVALSVLDSQTMSVPPAIYGVLMYIPAGLAVVMMRRRSRSLNTPLPT